jgi:hypothetical protein
MNAKKYIVATIVLNTVLLAAGACCYHSWRTHCADNGTVATPLSGLSGKFGPVIELVLPAETGYRPAGILDLETERMLPQPAFDDIGGNIGAITGWICTNGLDISCNVWSTGAACVTYDMAVVAVEGKYWEEATEEELMDKPALAPTMHSPRRQLILGANRPDTYVFRTGEGTLGVLRIVGLNEKRSGVRIRYKLIKPNNGGLTSAAAIGGIAMVLSSH